MVRTCSGSVRLTWIMPTGTLCLCTRHFFIISLELVGRLNYNVTELICSFFMMIRKDKEVCHSVYVEHIRLNYYNTMPLLSVMEALSC